ncbi:hypothetical protein Barb4_04943 [Bacteroidales bacterium Barb4]|nr:hypothetical protein Barb4_04943 [Bacteroidales bacterium Barb4]
MRSLAAVGIDNDFAPRQTGVAVRAADDELAGRIDMIGNVVVKQGLHPCGIKFLHAGDENGFHVGGYPLLHGGVSLLLCDAFGFDEIIVLGGNNDGVDAQGNAAVIVFDCHLTLGIGTEIGQETGLFLSYGSQFFEQGVRQIQRQRHVVFRFRRGIAEHHPLVACSLIHRVGTFHALVNLRTLLVNGGKDAAGLRFKLIFAFGVTNLCNHIAHNSRHIYVSLRLHFSRQDNLTGRNQRFASHFRLFVIRQKLIQHSI